MKSISFIRSNISKIYSTCDKNAVYRVCNEVAALCNRARNNGGRGRREHKLEEPVRVFGFRKAAVGKVGEANETVALSECKRIAHNPIRNPSKN